MPRSYEDYELFVDCFVRACLADADLPPDSLEAEVDRWRGAWRALANAPSSAAGAAGTEPLPPRLLPPAMTPHLAGRGTHIEEMNRLLPGTLGGQEFHVAAITGPPGVGKTALAVHWAHAVVEHFPDGQLYVDLCGWDGSREPLTPETVLSRFLRDMRVPDAELPTTLDELQARFRTETADRRMLLVLDNAARPDQVRPLMPGSRHCRTVVTSRAPLTGIGARALPLRELGETESFELIASLIGVARAQDESASVNLLTQLCARLPLALRIVGESIAIRPAISITEAAEEIAEESTRLDVLALGSDETHDVRSVFSWSLRSLSPESVRLFQLLALHEGPDLPLSVVAALADVVPATARSMVQTLVRVNLIEQRQGGRYRFHDLLRLYARERAVKDISKEQRNQALKRLATWYLKAGDTCDRVFAPQRRRVPIDGQNFLSVPEAPYMADHRAAFAWGDLERENVLSVARQCAREDLGQAAWQLPAVMGEYFYLRRMWPELYASHRDALPSAERVGLFAESWVRSNLGFAASHLEMYREAERHCRKAVEATTDIGDPSSTGIAWNNLGIALSGLQEWDEAVAAFERALDLHRSHDNLWGEAHAVTNLARAYSRQNKWDAAAENYTRAIELHGTIGNRAVEGSMFHELGLVHAAQTQWQRATDCYQHALAVHNEVDNRIGAGITLDDLGTALMAMGHREAALGQWHQALIILDELAHPRAALVRDRLASATH